MPATEAAGSRRADAEEHLVRHLVEAGLAGPVATPTRASLENCRRLVNGEPDYTFGLSDWRHATYEEALAAVRAAGGSRVVADAAGSDHGCIDPDATMAGIRAHRDALASLVAGGGARVLLATGHPFALLAH
ncbi:MAG TPA: phosphatase, partial [Acidimicrobiales bacterium]|nr:phosphatase [Acidimicrobiales bacterium]